MAPDPLVMVTRRRPVAVYPNEARAWGRASLFMNDYRWRGPDVHRNPELGEAMATAMIVRHTSNSISSCVSFFEIQV